MDALYACDEASAAEGQARLPNAPSYSAVRALLAKLVDKGHELDAIERKVAELKARRGKGRPG